MIYKICEYYDDNDKIHLPLDDWPDENYRDYLWNNQLITHRYIKNDQCEGELIEYIKKIKT